MPEGKDKGAVEEAAGVVDEVIVAAEADLTKLTAEAEAFARMAVVGVDGFINNALDAGEVAISEAEKVLLDLKSKVDGFLSHVQGRAKPQDERLHEQK